MNIRLKNIGIVKDSTIKIDGLTVITGKNNSGKTTVGKALYSIYDALSDIGMKSQVDKRNYIQKGLSRLEEKFQIFRAVDYAIKNNSIGVDDYPHIYELLSGPYIVFKNYEDAVKYIPSLIDEISKLNCNILATSGYYSHDIKYYQSEFDFGTPKEIMSPLNYKKNLDAEKDKVIVFLKNLYSTVLKDTNLSNYARESINQTLRIEFSNQIQPVFKDNAEQSKIIIEDNDGNKSIDISIDDNKVIESSCSIFTNSPIDNVYMIDDPFIFDRFVKISLYRSQFTNSDIIFDPSRIRYHREKLEKELNRPTHLSVFEQTVISSDLEMVMEKINNALPGDFDISTEGNFYIQNGKKLDISNLATGSKMFAILKMLMSKGLVGANTLLILDEPESHLHPQWQNAFAEIIVLLVKYLHVSILLTTHSPNFMLALDGNMRKYGIQSNSNFYQTEKLEDGVGYKCVNDDFGKIYEDFMLYFSEMKKLRDDYFEGKYNDKDE